MTLGLKKKLYIPIFGGETNTKTNTDFFAEGGNFFPLPKKQIGGI